MFRFGKDGLFMRYKGDTLLYRWKWARECLDGQAQPFKSLFFQRDFNSLGEYLSYRRESIPQSRLVMSGNRKVLGLSTQSLILDWVRSNPSYREEILIVLSHIDLSKRSFSYWKSLGVDTLKPFLEDFVILRCPDYSQAKSILESVPEDFASAMLIRDGYLMATNSQNEDL